MWSDGQVDWLGRIGRAAFVLLFLAGEGRPVRAREISRRLKADYETARKYLFELAELGAAVRTPAGWRPTPAACRLVVSATSPEEPPEPPPMPEAHSAAEPRRAENPRLAEGAGPRENPGADESRENAENPHFKGAAGPRLSGARRLNAVLPRPGEPIIIIKVNEDFKDSFKDSFKEPESLIITIRPENAAEPRGGEAEKPRFDGAPGESADFVGDGATAGFVVETQNLASLSQNLASLPPTRPAELGEALHRAGILLNPRTRRLFGSDYLTAAHVAGSEHQLKKCKGRNYQPGLLVVALEGIRPGEPPAPVGFDGRDPSRYAEWND